MIAAALVLLLAPTSTVVLAGDPDDREVARALASEWVQQGFDVQSEQAVQQRLAPLSSGEELVSLSQAQSEANAADERELSGDLTGAADVLREVIRRLEADALPTSEKAAFIQALRIRAANLLMGAAGPDETGGASTPQGKAALALLVDALVANPTLVLDAERYPPRMRRLVEQARVALTSVGLGALEVTSTPSGGQVFIDGRALGTTPLRLANVLPRGRHRLWVVHEGRRSTTRTFTLDETPTVLEVDVALCAAVNARAMAVDRTAVVLTKVRRQALLRGLQTDDLLVVWTEGAVIEGVRIDAEGDLTARARVPADGQRALQALANALAENAKQAPFPAWLEEPQALAEAATAAPAAEATTDDDAFPWLWVGGGVGAGAAAVVLAGATASAIAVAVIATQPTGAGTFTVAVQP